MYMYMYMYMCTYMYVCTIYNMSDDVVSDLQS